MSNSTWTWPVRADGPAGVDRDRRRHLGLDPLVSGGCSPEADQLRALLDADEACLAVPVRIELLAGGIPTRPPAPSPALSALPVLYPSDDTWRLMDAWVDVACRSPDTVLVSAICSSAPWRVKRTVSSGRSIRISSACPAWDLWISTSRDDGRESAHQAGGRPSSHFAARK